MEPAGLRNMEATAVSLCAGVVIWREGGALQTIVIV